MWAAAENHADAIRVLAEAGADINARSTLLDAPVLEFPRSGGPNSPFPRGGWTALMFAAREGAIDAARALAELGAESRMSTALPQTDIPLKPEELTAAEQGHRHDRAGLRDHQRRTTTSRRCCSRRAPIRTSWIIAGMGALYAAVDMNSLQWVQGRPAPILTDKLDGVDLVKLLLRTGADPNARLKRAAAEASSRRRLDAELRRGHDAADARGADQRRRRHESCCSTAAPIRSSRCPIGTNALMIAAGQGYGGLRGEGIRIVVPTPRGAVEAVHAAARPRHGRRCVQQRRQHRAARGGRPRRRRREVPGRRAARR